MNALLSSKDSLVVEPVHCNGQAFAKVPVHEIAECVIFLEIFTS